MDDVFTAQRMIQSNQKVLYRGPKSKITTSKNLAADGSYWHMLLSFTAALQLVNFVAIYLDGDKVRISDVAVSEAPKTTSDDSPQQRSRGATKEGL